MHAEEVIHRLIEGGLLCRTKIYGAKETLDQGTPAIYFVANPYIVPVEEQNFKSFVDTAIEAGTAQIVYRYQKEIDREGPPNDYEYHWWENNVRYEVGTATVTLTIEGNEVTLSIDRVTPERTYWTGY